MDFNISKVYMNDEDRQIAKDWGLIIAEALLSTAPVLGVAFKICDALYGANLKIRQRRALEWVEMVRDNPSIFIKEVLQDEGFQEGFIYAVERYIKERNEDKRLVMKEIFLGFAQSSNMSQFALERMYHVVSILNASDFIVLRDVVAGLHFYQIYGNTPEKNENIYNLINTGVLMSDYSAKAGPVAAPFVRLTEFGREFLKYLQAS